MLQICMQDILAMLPQPIIALLLLFPITDDSEAASKAGKGQIQFSNIAPFCHVNISSHGYLTLRQCLSTCAFAISSILGMSASASQHLYFQDFNAEAERLTKEGYSPPQEAYFMKQTIGNACGTIGLLHALANNQTTVSISERCHLLALHAILMLDTRSMAAHLAVLRKE